MRVQSTTHNTANKREKIKTKRINSERKTTIPKTETTAAAAAAAANEKSHSAQSREHDAK